MPVRRVAPIVAAAALAYAAALPAHTAQTPAREPLAVMSFNIRYGTANDGDNHWTRRRGFLVDVMRDADADLVGLQEALDHQIAALLQALPPYGVIGVGRDDGRTRGEYAAILYRRDRFRVADAGTFWFSHTPEVVASRSWGNRITRRARASGDRRARGGDRPHQPKQPLRIGSLPGHRANRASPMNGLRDQRRGADMGSYLFSTEMPGSVPGVALR
jgi:hypothetical protein